MTKNSSAIGNAIMNVFWFMVMLYSFFLVHEATHLAVAQNMGCEAEINPVPFSDINRNYGAFLSTTQDCSAISEKREFEVNKIQSQVEVVGYQLLPFFVLFTIYFLSYMNREETKDSYYKFQEKRW